MLRRLVSALHNLLACRCLDTTCDTELLRDDTRVEESPPDEVTDLEASSAQALDITVDEWRVLPPHLPASAPCEPATADAVKQWEKHRGTDLEAALASGAIALLDGAWLVAHSRTLGARLRRRQELPDEAFVSLDAIKTAGTAGILNPVLRIICISHVRA